MKRTAQVVKETRKALGLTQQEFADRLGIHRVRIAKYETSRSEPPGGVMLRIIELGRASKQDAT